MGLGEVTVGEVMTPRTDVIAIPDDSTVEEAMAIMLDEGHLRLPVFEETIDKVTGLLLARDLWRAHRDGVTQISEIVRPVQFLPTTKLVEDLIPEMRVQRTKMAIVIDEFGGTAGLVTLEDLIEEIVGEIQDEHEEDEPLSFEEMENGTVRIWGGVAVREVNDRLDLSISEEPHDTLGGYVFGELNRIGSVGDVVKIENAHLRIVQMRGRRVEYLVLIRDTPLAAQAD
jgi:CBS domain containing-hemolysin-like protein